MIFRNAEPADVPTILGFIRELAEFEREPNAVKMTEPQLHAALFGPKPGAEALLVELDGAPPSHRPMVRKFQHLDRPPRPRHRRRLRPRTLPQPRHRPRDLRPPRQTRHHPELFSRRMASAGLEHTRHSLLRKHRGDTPIGLVEISLERRRIKCACCLNLKARSHLL